MFKAVMFKDENYVKKGGETLQLEDDNYVRLLAISAAFSSSSTAAKPLMCLLYE